jgi:CheY-like chemotaxis protein
LVSGQNAQIDLILTDHNMPEMDGLELADALRQRGNETPIILLSSHPGFAEKDPARRHLHALMQKPVRRKELFAKLESLGGIHDDVVLPMPTPVSLIAPVRRMRVLAAEDNKTNQLVFSKMVKDLDIELEFVNNGIEAVEAFKSFAPDLIFMDISMPQMDGKEATRAIRALQKDGKDQVVIVALTAHAMDGDDQGILEAGLDHYLTKPLRKPQIYAQIEQTCPKDAVPPLPPAVLEG